MCRWGLAQMAPNGTPPLTGNCTIHVQARATEEQMDFCWAELQKQHNATLPPELRAYSAECPALLCHYAREHLLNPRLPIVELVAGIDDKFVAEVGWAYFTFAISNKAQSYHSVSS